MSEKDEVEKQAGKLIKAMSGTLMCASLCSALRVQIEQLPEIFPKESAYQDHLKQSLRDLQRLESLLDNIGAGLVSMFDHKSTGAVN